MGRFYSAILIFLSIIVLGDLYFERGLSVTVTYDRKALVIDGKRRVLISGSVHYPRSTPDVWPEIIRKAKEGGLDVIETYVFWNSHEPQRGQYYFEERFDLVRFVKTVHEAGLYVHLRIGPYTCAEWNYGGFPLWLHFIPGIQFRTTNEPFKQEMERFLAKIVALMKEENLFAPQGGPIILAQVENEYGNVEWAYGVGGKLYVKWAASTAISLNTSVPWVMCSQDDAPDPIINTCNGFYCDTFTPNSPSKPKMWTENYPGWFLSFGYAIPFRPAEDIAFSVARFFETGGTLQNYYMYFGGTNFGRTVGGPLVATSYDYDAPIDEYAFLRQPKWSHLRDLHNSIKLCEKYLVNSDATYLSLGTNLEAHIYNDTAGCAAFLANIDNSSNAHVSFNGNTYELPAWSVSILPDCKNVIYNTAKTSFVAPEGNGPLALNLSSMGKGEAWVNGQSIGRYWPANLSPSAGCSEDCDYRGPYDSNKCLKNCGEPAQVLYHVPRSWVLRGENLLVLHEDLGGDPSKITVLTKTGEEVCAFVSETDPPHVDSWRSSSVIESLSPEIRLSCERGWHIASFSFASFGTPKGQCGNFKHGLCSADGVLPIMQEACIGQDSCSVTVSTLKFGDPCPGVHKSLAVEALCSQ